MVKRGQGAFEYILLLAGVLLIVVLAIIILRGTIGKSGTQADLNNCKVQIAGVSVCTNTTGGWTGGAQGVNDGCGADGCLYTNYGVSLACEDALSGTPWDDNGAINAAGTLGTDDDVDRFICGPRPA
ncbi:class III signal peptide-containing protein [Candidatus Micrarchaeota archaeon]|nr:class III signal peptide-containing protein [Candidatus Micrarchaeota archaeon]